VWYGYLFPVFSSNVVAAPFGTSFFIKSQPDLSSEIVLADWAETENDVVKQVVSIKSNMQHRVPEAVFLHMGKF
jgi:hypothetical protein